MDDLTVTNRIDIHADAKTVWNALVNPEETKKYMFGCETISGWQVGDSLLWKGYHEGKELIFVKGFILSIVPYEFLKYSVIDPFASYPDVPENYLNVSYELREENNVTTLVVIQDGFEHAAEGQKRYEEAYNNGEGWRPILTAIKDIVENNK